MPKKANKDKRLRAKVNVGTYPNGEPIIKWAQGYTPAELEENKAEVRRTYVGNAIKVDRKIVVCTCIERWYADTKDDSLSASSKKNLALAINSYINPKIGQKRMQAVTHEDLRDVMRSVASKGKTLIGDVYSVLTGTFAYAAGRRMIDYNPAEGLKKPSAKSTSRRAFYENETQAVLKLIAELTDRSDKLLLMCLYYLGLRRGEALGLQWADINFKEATVHIQRDIDFAEDQKGLDDDVKSEDSDRVIPIPPALLQELLRCRGIGQAYVIEAPRTKTHWSKSTYDRRWLALMVRLHEIDPSIEHKTVTLSPGRKGKNGQKIPPKCFVRSALTAHYFRHNYATLLYYAGVELLDAQRYLGHSDPETTLRIYTHLRKIHEHSQRDKINNIFQSEAIKTDA